MYLGESIFSHQEFLDLSTKQTRAHRKIQYTQNGHIIKTLTATLDISVQNQVFKNIPCKFIVPVRRHDGAH